MALPHIQNSEAGRNLYEPYHNCFYYVYFTLPEALQKDFAQDEALISEHVKTVGGLDALDNGPDTSVKQKFMGSTRTYVAPKPDSTSIDDLSIVFTLNLRNGVDNYIYKLFKAWKNLNYNLEDGSTTLKKDYTAKWMKIEIANRVGDVIREVVLKDVMLKGKLEGMGDLDYESGDAKDLTVHFTSDWAKDTVA